MAGRVLVVGGAGFVGSHLALAFARDSSGRSVTALDNLRRAGSELAVERLRAGGVEFVHGDVRRFDDLDAHGELELVLDCCAEPSVRAGYEGDARYVVDTNLLGTAHCLELARRRGAGLVFLSTSRVHSIDALRALPLERRGDRLALPDDASGRGWSARGLTLDFPTDGPRTLYGTTKLCSELLVQEYAHMFGVPAVVDRCGVVAGPWQMGRVDQGFVALWAARSLYGAPLAYTGFGGEGLQVRDVLHVDDLCELVALQARELERHAGCVYAVGGGIERSVSLRELTALCEARSGRRLEVGSRPETHPSDVPYHVTDERDARERTGWAPRRSLETLLDDVFRWLEDSRGRLEGLFRP